jgi:hypothetical protein
MKCTRGGGWTYGDFVAEVLDRARGHRAFSGECGRADNVRVREYPHPAYTWLITKVHGVLPINNLLLTHGYIVPYSNLGTKSIDQTTINTLKAEAPTTTKNLVQRKGKSYTQRESPARAT